MNYEQEYKEALERARMSYHTGDYDKDTLEMLEIIFPELKESEDEKIRRRIIHTLHGDVLDMEETTKALAWLERQGEHANFRNKIQVGDKVTRNEDGVLVNLSQLERVAKPSEKQGEQKASYTTIVETGDGGINALVTRELHTDSEQRPTDKIKPFDKYEGLTDFERTLADICIGWIGEEIGWKQYIKDNADVLLKIAIKKFNSVQDAPFEQKSEENKGNVGGISPNWSEEDERMFNSCCAAVAAADYYTLDDKQDIENWLKSLKDRIQPQPKQEWSEEDEEILRTILSDGIRGAELDMLQVNWLKSLRPQNHWKPSSEQMKALNAINVIGGISYAGQGQVLIELYNDLKKLKEE